MSRCFKYLAVGIIVILLLLTTAWDVPSVLGKAPEAQTETRLRVATKKFEPFVIKDGDRWTGFSIDLWDALARELNLQYDWIEVNSVTEQLQAVQNGDADAAIAGISMTAEREQIVDFSFPYFTAGLQIMTSTAASGSPLDQFPLLASPALRQILIIGLILIIVLAHIIWLLERKHNPTFQRGYFTGIGEGLWAAILIIATGEFGDRDVPNIVRRFMVASMWLLGVVLVAQFTATVTSALTVQQLNGAINAPEDLPGKRVAAVRGTTGAQYLQDHSILAIEVEKITDAYTLLEQGQVDAVVYDSPVLLYYAATAGKGRVQVVGPIFNEDTYGIALPTGSPYRKPINEGLLKLRQNGTYEELYTKWFGGK